MCQLEIIPSHSANPYMHMQKLYATNVTVSHVVYYMRAADCSLLLKTKEWNQKRILIPSTMIRNPTKYRLCSSSQHTAKFH
jgi:hypothetical protein